MNKVQEISKEVSKDVSFENIVTNAIKIPGVKVDRADFLTKIFGKEEVDLEQIIEVGPIVANCPEDMIARMANKLIFKRTSESSAVSFAAGIPGGLAMAATIPADTLQFFGMTLKLAQELTYLYGANDLWKNGEIDSSKVRDQLILYCGVMFGVAGASAGLRLLSAQVAKQTLKKLPQQALTKTFWYPIVKQICKVIGIKITKDTAAKGISKAVPVLGGIVSGGITFASMRPMGKRLAEALHEANYNYSEEKAMEDYEIIEEITEDYEEVETDEEVNGTSDKIPNSEIINKQDKNKEKRDDVVVGSEEDIFEKIEKLAKLKSIGAITEEEFKEKKRELLTRI